MTVKELKEALNNYPEDAQIFLYSEIDECDGFLDKISLDTLAFEHDDTIDETFMYSPHYCQSDSEAEQYWYAQGGDKPVLFLIATNYFKDFTTVGKSQ